MIYRKEIIEKHVSPQRISNINIPELIGFLILIDPQYPIHPPKVLAKTNVHTHIHIHTLISFIVFNTEIDGWP